MCWLLLSSLTQLCDERPEAEPKRREKGSLGGGRKDSKAVDAWGWRDFSEESSQGLNMHSILDEYLSLVSRIHDRCLMTACNINYWASNTFWSLQACALIHTYSHIDTFSHIIKYNKNQSFKIKLKKE